MSGSTVVRECARPLFLGCIGGISTAGAIAMFAAAAMGIPTVATQAHPTLPIALADACFPPNCADESCMPSFSQVPSGDNLAVWTGFTGSSDVASISALFPPPCGSGDGTIPLLELGDAINLNDRQTTLIANVYCEVCDLGMQTFLVPVFHTADCGGPASPSAVVVGFVYVKVVSFNSPSNVVGCDSGSQNQVQSLNLKTTLVAPTPTTTPVMDTPTDTPTLPVPTDTPTTAASETPTQTPPLPPTKTSTRTSTPACCGDTDGDHIISTAEATRAILALSNRDFDSDPAAQCTTPGTIGTADTTKIILNLVNRTCNP